MDSSRIEKEPLKKDLHGFACVDRQEDPQQWVKTLDVLAQHPFFRGYRRKIFETLSPARSTVALELGSGTGQVAHSVQETFGCKVVCCDLSKAMVAETRKRGCELSLVGDAHSLPFKDRFFSYAWADRTLQHLDDPEKALKELLRVLKPWGRLILADPDYGTQFMAFPDQSLAAKVFQFRAKCAVRNGTLAHQVPALLSSVGFREILVETQVLQIEDPMALDHVMGLRTWGQAARDADFLTSDELEAWNRLFDECVKTRRFMWGVTFFLTGATKPGL